jgi:hypothetical protein
MPCEGGAAVPVPRNGGLVAFESPDGKWLYYIRPDDSPSLWKMAAGGGEEAQIVPPVQARTFAVTAAGIYFMHRRSTVVRDQSTSLVSPQMLRKRFCRSHARLFWV